MAPMPLMSVVKKRRHLEANGCRQYAVAKQRRANDGGIEKAALYDVSRRGQYRDGEATAT